MNIISVKLSSKNQEGQLSRQIESQEKKGLSVENVIPVEYSMDKRSNRFVLSKVALHVRKRSSVKEDSEELCTDLEDLTKRANQHEEEL
jgi:hypothetical protein